MKKLITTVAIFCSLALPQKSEAGILIISSGAAVGFIGAMIPGFLFAGAGAGMTTVGIKRIVRSGPRGNITLLTYGIIALVAGVDGNISQAQTILELKKEFPEIKNAEVINNLAAYIQIQADQLPFVQEQKVIHIAPEVVEQLIAAEDLSSQPEVMTRIKKVLE